MRAIAALYVVLALPLLAACGYSTEEVQDEPVLLTVQVPTAWGAVGTCLAAHYATNFETLYLPVPSERRSKLILKFVGPGIIQYKSIQAIFEISGADPTTVVFRQRPILVSTAPTERAVREVIDRCGKA